MFATDGTREFLAGEGVEVRSVNELTDGAADARWPGQDLPSRDLCRASSRAATSPSRWTSSKTQGIAPIDLVVVNVKPFAPSVGAKLVGIDEAIEMIDVGGAALLGAAARNSAGVAAASDPSHYDAILAELRELGQVSAETRAQLAAEAFSTVAAYHAEIAAYLNQISGNALPAAASRSSSRRSTTCATARTRTSARRSTARRPTGAATLADATQLQGGRPSFNNLLDLDAAYLIARDYTAPTVTIVKHTDPVGLASHDELVEAYRHALETDPVASFGGIVGVNRELDGATARGDRRELVRGGRRAGVQRRGASGS